MLLVLQALLDAGQIPPVLGSEYLPDLADPQRQHFPHQDLCDLTLPDGSVDVVLCNELFEHLYDLPAIAPAPPSAIPPSTGSPPPATACWARGFPP